MNVLFKGLTELETEEIMHSLPSPVPFAKGDELYKTGAVGIICSGKATIRRIGLSGQPLVIRTLGADDIFGAASIFGDWKEGKSSIIAESGGEIIYIDEPQFKKLLSENDNINFNYIAFLTERIRFLNMRIDAFSAGSTEQKLYEFLLAGKNANNDFILDMSMSKLSSMLNVGRTSLYRDLRSLENKKLIIRQKNIIHIY